MSLSITPRSIERAALGLVFCALLTLVTSCKVTVDPLQSPPRIARFYPETVAANANDTVIGSGFGTRNSALTASIGSTLVNVVSTNDTMIVLRAPAMYLQDTIHLKRDEVWVSASGPLTVLNTVAERQLVVPDTAPRGTLITVYGDQFARATGHLALLVGGLEIPIENVYSDRLTFRIPDNGFTGEVVIANEYVKLFQGTDLIVSHPSVWRSFSSVGEADGKTSSYRAFGWSQFHAITVDSDWQAPNYSVLRDSGDVTPAVLRITATGYEYQFDNGPWGNGGAYVSLRVSLDTIHHTASLQLSAQHKHEAVVPFSITADTALGCNAACTYSGWIDAEMHLTLGPGTYNTAQLRTHYEEADHAGEHDILTTSITNMPTLELVLKP